MMVQELSCRQTNRQSQTDTTENNSIFATLHCANGNHLLWQQYYTRRLYTAAKVKAARQQDHLVTLDVD